MLNEYCSDSEIKDTQLRDKRCTMSCFRYIIILVIALGVYGFIQNFLTVSLNRRWCPTLETEISCSKTQEKSSNAESVIKTSPVCAKSSDSMIYFITPTYPRPQQVAEITRLANTLHAVPRLHWILAEDSGKLNARIEEYLKYLKLNYTYLLAPKSKNKSDAKGATGRIVAVNWIKINNISEGVVYFGDDDNTYDLRLFDDIRSTKNIAMWPVGLVTSFGLSTPIVKDGKVIDFYDGWIAKRKFPIDMAGFALSVPLLLRGKLDQVYNIGYAETKYIESLNVTKEEIEVKGENCTKIYVWHTKTITYQNATKIDFQKWNVTGTNLDALSKLLY